MKALPHSEVSGAADRKDQASNGRSRNQIVASSSWFLQLRGAGKYAGRGGASLILRGGFG